MENRFKKFKYILINYLRVVKNFIKCVEEVFIKYFSNENNYNIYVSIYIERYI